MVFIVGGQMGPPPAITVVNEGFRFGSLTTNVIILVSHCYWESVLDVRILTSCTSIFAWSSVGKWKKSLLLGGGHTQT